MESVTLRAADGTLVPLRKAAADEAGTLRDWLAETSDDKPFAVPASPAALQWFANAAHGFAWRTGVDSALAAAVLSAALFLDHARVSNAAAEHLAEHLRGEPAAIKRLDLSDDAAELVLVHCDRFTLAAIRAPDDGWVVPVDRCLMSQAWRRRQLDFRWSGGGRATEQKRCPFPQESRLVPISGDDGNDRLVTGANLNWAVWETRPLNCGRWSPQVGGGRFGGTVHCVAVSADEELVAAAVDDTVQIWALKNTAHGKLGVCPGCANNPAGGHSGKVESVCFDPLTNMAGMYTLASGGSDRQVILWQIPPVPLRVPPPGAQGESLRNKSHKVVAVLAWHTSDVKSLACDGEFLCSAGGNLVCVWKEWRARNAEQRGPVLRIQSSPDHRLWHESAVITICVRGGTAAAGCFNGQVVTWDLENIGLPDANMTNCRPDLRRVLYHGGRVESVDLALPHLLVAGGRDHFHTSGIISVWSLEGDTKSERVATLTPERAEGCAADVSDVVSVALVQGGTRIASIDRSPDPTRAVTVLRMWDPIAIENT